MRGGAARRSMPASYYQSRTAHRRLVPARTRPSDDALEGGAPLALQPHQRTAEDQPQPGHEGVDDMAATRIIEQESGTYSGRVHPHNGYYAGDFSGLRHGTRNSDTRIPTRSTRVLDSRAV
jgi:hypothetical protein